MTARDEIRDILINEYADGCPADALLDAYAMESIRKALSAMRTEYIKDRFSPNEDDGLYSAMDYLLNLVFDCGEVRPRVVHHDIHSWCFYGGDA